MSGKETAELIGMVRELQHSVNTLVARVDRHMAETDTRIAALQIDAVEEKKSGIDWLVSYITSFPA